MTSAVAGTGSASETIAKEVSGSHVLTIAGYRIAKRIARGEFIRSSPFSVAGHRWCALYYPDGNSSRDSINIGYISIYFELHPTGDPDVKALFTVSLLDENGEPVPYYTRSTSSLNVPRFTCMSEPRGVNKLIRDVELQGSGHIRDDSIRFRCHITVLKVVHIDDAHRPTTTRFVVVPPSNMDQDLGRLLTSGKGADIAFEVAGETFAAHRSILATRSPVFMAEFFGPMEMTATCVQIEDIEARVFKALLHFVYTDSLPEIEQGESMAMSQHLLVAGDRYGLERLKLICEDSLCNYIDAGTVGTILTLAEQHGCHGLKKACFQFLMSGNNLKAAIATDGFAHLTNSCPSVLKELLSKLTVA